MTDGAEIELGTEDLYRPTCCQCFEERIGADNPLRNPAGIHPAGSACTIGTGFGCHVFAFRPQRHKNQNQTNLHKET
jgi:hypothetical protein